MINAEKGQKNESHRDPREEGCVNVDRDQISMSPEKMEGTKQDTSRTSGRLRSLLTLVVVLGSKSLPWPVSAHSEHTANNSPAIPANTWILDFCPPKVTGREGISVVLSHKACDGLSCPGG